MKKTIIIVSCLSLFFATILTLFFFYEKNQNEEKQSLISELKNENMELALKLIEKSNEYNNLLSLYESQSSRIENIDVIEASYNQTISQYAMANETLSEAIDEKDLELQDKDLIIANKQDQIDGKQKAIEELQNTISDLNKVIDSSTKLTDSLLSRLSTSIGSAYSHLYKSCILDISETKEEINEVLTNTAEIQKYCSTIDAAENTILSLAEYFPDFKPVNGTITSLYGKRETITNGKTVTSFHNGLDISYAPYLDVVSAAAGKVVEANTVDNGDLGLYIVIDHGNGYKTVYAHLSEVHVKVGQKVTKGEFIGCMGESGAARGIHLHIEVFFNGQRQDPLDYFDYEQ